MGNTRAKSTPDGINEPFSPGRNPAADDPADNFPFRPSDHEAILDEGYGTPEDRGLDPTGDKPFSTR